MGITTNDMCSHDVHIAVTYGEWGLMITCYESSAEQAHISIQYLLLY